MRYQTPQFIESEGKIIFFLTFRQFFLLAGGGAICFTLYFFIPFLYFLLASFFIMLLVVVVAFLKINGLPVVTVFLNYIGFLMETKNYTWKQQAQTPLPKEKPKEEIPYQNTGPQLTPSNSRLSSAKQLVELRKK